MADKALYLDGLAGVARIAGTVLFSPLLRPWYRRWGATPEEARRALPGDALVPQPKSEIALAISIPAPPERVWPWFVQLGCGRGGWYSYDMLDNAGRPSAERILPEHQQIQVGDEIWATPDGKLKYPVVEVRPGQALVLGGTLDTSTAQEVEPAAPRPAAYFSGVLAWVLEPLEVNRTRLIFRQRTDWNPSFVNALMYRVFLEPIAFVMGRRMLLGIERRNRG